MVRMRGSRFFSQWAKTSKKFWRPNKGYSTISEGARSILEGAQPRFDRGHGLFERGTNWPPKSRGAALPPPWIRECNTCSWMPEHWANNIFQNSTIITKQVLSCEIDFILPKQPIYIWNIIPKIVYILKWIAHDNIIIVTNFSLVALIQLFTSEFSPFDNRTIRARYTLRRSSNRSLLCFQ